MGMLRDEFGREADGYTSSLAEPVLTAIVCNSSLLRAGLWQLLSGTRFVVPDPSREGMASTHSEAPALFIVNVTESRQQTLDLVRGTKGQHPNARVALVADQFDLDLILSGATAGVDSFCLTTRGHDILLNVLELTMIGEKVLPGTVLQSLLDQTQSLACAGQTAVSNEQTHRDPRVNKLSPRETVILHSLMDGDANKVIARKLDIAEATIKVHLKSILRKIGAANRTQAAMWANQNLRVADQPSLNT
jgi:two-component system nitrate/nitrite response regulator NarL